MPDVWVLLGSALLAFLIAGALAPFEALGWWAGWFGDEDAPAPVAAELPSSAPHYVVFLTGIHSVTGETYAGRERNLLAQLHEALPEAKLLEVFPYSANDRPLTGERFLAWFWRWAAAMKLGKRTLARLAGALINLRNGWQVAVSVDRRYGPIYNEGTARTIQRTLQEEGYRAGSDAPVTLIGYSGGGQIAAGAAPRLKALLRSPVFVISLGGVLGSDSRLPELDGFYHLTGSRDRTEKLGVALFPGRWKLLPHSGWNQALRRGVIQLVPLGAVGHTGAGGYLDSRAMLPGGTSHLEQTVAVISGIISGITPASTRPTPDVEHRTPHRE